MKIRNLFTSDNLPVWIVVLSFGPYVFPNAGLRTEHLLIYSILPFAILSFLFNKRPVFYDPRLFFIFILITMLAILTFLSTIFGYNYIIEHAPVGKIISHTEKYLRPLAVIILLCVFFRVDDEYKPRTALVNVNKALIYMLAIHGIFILVQLFVDVSFITDYFVVGFGASDLEIRSSAQNALMMGKFTGIFNQSAEAGLAYTLGLFSMSKIFIFLGVPLFVIYLLVISRHVRIFNPKLFIFLIVCSIIISYLVNFLERESSTSFSYSLHVLMAVMSDPVFILTGGRFGNVESTMVGHFADVWATDPIFGMGFASYLCFDNGYFEFFAQGGLICLIGFVVLLMSMAWIALKHVNIAEGKLLIFTVILMSGAAVGMPPLTANRFSPIIWVFIVLIYFVFYSKKYLKQYE